MAVAINHAVPYLRTALGFMGMTDVEVVLVEGLVFGDEAASKATSDSRPLTGSLAAAA